MTDQAINKTETFNDDRTLNVILIDDDKDLIAALSQAYELADFNVQSFRNPVQALKHIHDGFDGAVVTDVRMPEMDGLDLYKRINKIDPKLPVIVMTGHADVPMVLSTLKEGIFDFLAKPIATEELISATRRACETRALVLENRELRNLTDMAAQEDILIGNSHEMTQLRELISQIANAEVDILIEGETGTGTEAVARIIHKLSHRARHKFIPINCAALSGDSALEELFGLDGTSQTHFRRKRIGKIEMADRGVLYLDKLDSIPSHLQGQILRVVENRDITPIGASQSKHVNIRIIASATEDLIRRVDMQTFRSDLYFKLNTIKIKVPALRDRKEDIPLLFAHFLNEAAKKFNKKVPHIKKDARKHLYEHNWPGNIQELKNFAQATILGVTHPNDSSDSGHLTLPQKVEYFEAATIQSALRQCAGNVPETIKVLGIPRKTFYDKINRHNIDLKKYRV